MLEAQEVKSTRNLPVYIICPHTRHRIINQVMYEEFIYGLLDKEYHWEDKAAKRLASYGIILSPQTLLMNRKKIQSGERDPACVANFCGGINEEEVFTSRYGKDGMYKQFKMLINLFIPRSQRHYVGLPANQILSIVKEYGYDKVVACEKNEGMIYFMSSLQRYFGNGDGQATIIKDDIFSYLNKTDKKFSIYDFDLMCHISSENLIDNLIHSISSTSSDQCVVNIATTIGRKISEQRYREMMPGLFIQGILDKMDIIAHYSDGYNDRIIPMRYEMFVLRKKTIEN